MKQVIEKTETTVRPAECSEQKYYGLKTDQDKGFIIQERYKSGEFYAVCVESLTYHNSWNSNSNLNQLIRQLVKDGFKVYEFDTPEELFAWLAKKA